MERKEILNIISEIIPQTKNEGDLLKKKTIVDTFHVGGLSGNRLNSGTLRSQFIICEKETDWDNSDISAKKTIHSDQRVFVQKDNKDIWDVYVGKTQDSESEDPVLLLHNQPNLADLLLQERVNLLSESRVPSTLPSEHKSKQVIYYGCPGSGKSHEVRNKTNTFNDEGFAGLSSIERQQAYQKYLDDKHGHKKTYKGGGTNIYALTHPKLMGYISSCTEYEINSLFEISNEGDFNAIMEALKGCEAYQNDSITKGSGCHWETGLKSYGEFLKDQNHNTERRKDAVFRTTFHPDTDYAAFVGCYKPGMNDGVIEYSFTPQVFTNAYIAAWENTKKSVYLVIEEINRGNCAQIFGDLFQLLDRKSGVSEYPVKADKDLADYLRRTLGEDHEGIKNSELKLPSNLIIWATMNTSDQSLFPMDSAFKRRWDWEYVPIEYGQKKSNKKINDSYNFIIKIGGNKYKWIKFLRKVNDKIYDTTLSEDKQMGNYFIKGDVDELQFVNKVMFYLWNEVCKEEYKTQRNFFRKGKAKDNEECQEFKFVDLFTAEEGKNIEQTRVDILTQFMVHLEVTPEPEPKGENSEPKNNEQPAEQ